MCGIAGIIKSCEKSMPLAEIAGEMAARLRHRGPDGQAVWYENNVALSHARLKVVDLSENADQPMISASGRFVLVFNGEIYNAGQLRREVPYPYKGTGDTEVLLATIETLGVEAALPRLRGMFAFAVWDQQCHTLTLARDRLGIKPLYYGNTPDAFAFGSELKTFFAIPSFKPEIDRAAQQEFLQYGCVGGDRCIFKGLRKLLPGHWLTITENTGQPPVPQPYWSAPQSETFTSKSGRFLKPRNADDDILLHTEELLLESVREHMVSDVPLGTFLSGGIDSPLITALMQKCSPRPVKTFTIAFEDDVYDESIAANNIARHLKTDHTEIMLTTEQAQAVIPKLAQMYDEPFGDSSQIPTALVCQEARKHVTVCLSGDGGDELFGGYNRHIHTPALWHLSRQIPRPIARLTSALIRMTPHWAWHHSHRLLCRLLPEQLAKRDVASTIQKMGRVLSSTSFPGLYEGLRSYCPTPSRYLIDAGHRNIAADWPELGSQHTVNTQTDWMRYCDLCSYLPDDILTKLDRASMAVSLEARVPFLDHRVVEFAMSLNASACIREKQGKWPLRMILEKYVPSGCRIQRKSGFGVPVGYWIKTDLRDWAESLLTKEMLNACGFQRANVLTCWKRHVKGQTDQTGTLWNILMYLAWHQEYFG